MSTAAREALSLREMRNETLVDYAYALICAAWEERRLRGSISGDLSEEQDKVLGELRRRKLREEGA